MMEMEKLKNRINNSGIEGVETSHIRDDYKPAGEMMIKLLTDSGEYVQRRTPMYYHNSTWRIFKKGSEPY